MLRYKNTKLFTSENAYVAFSSLSLFFHVLNNMKITESIKVFHLFAVLALLFGIKRVNIGRKPFSYVMIILLCTFFSSVLSYYNGSFMHFVTFAIVVISVLGVKSIPIDKLLYVNNLLAPIVILILYWLAFRGSYYRFCGFYDDPNYLCTTLLVYLFVILLFFKRTTSLFIKMGLGVEILMIGILVSYTLSRTGLACLLMMLLSAFYSFLMKSSKKTIVFAALMIIVLVWKFPSLIENQRYLYEERIFDNRDNMEAASSYRGQLSIRGIEYVLNHPQMIPLGIGLGGLAHNNVLPDFSSQDRHLDHNTFTSFFTEQGIICFICLVSLVLSTGKRVFNNRSSELGYFIFMTFAIFIIFGMSINQTTYLPYWWVLFLILNCAYNNEISSSLTVPFYNPKK